MSHKINDGGQAFPRAVQFDDAFIHGHGMTLRDYFAAAALTGYLGNPEGNSKWEISDVAQFCYRQADAMIRAREAK